ncbi:MAG: hypothetical protein HY335_07595, partial [Deinococcus sp.]|nr:hypothetical protein [Deinococcus sp.]
MEHEVVLQVGQFLQITRPREVVEFPVAVLPSIGLTSTGVTALILGLVLV